MGWLVGDVHEGIAQMFDVIEFARMMVGTKAIATLSTGYLNALDYAKERVQGADLTQIMDKTAPRVTVIHHPDVRRSLMTQKSYAEGLRALYLFTAVHQDKVDAAGGRGSRPAARDAHQRLPAAHRQGLRIRAFVRPAHRVASRLSAARASSRTTRSSSTSATRRSTASTKERPRSRDRTSSSGRSSGTTFRLDRAGPQIGDFAKGDAGNGRLARERELLGQALEDVQG